MLAFETNTAVGLTSTVLTTVLRSLMIAAPRGSSPASRSIEATIRRSSSPTSIRTSFSARSCSVWLGLFGSGAATPDQLR